MTLRAALVVLLEISAGGVVRVVGHSHGEPRWIYHPDVPKQAVVARSVYDGHPEPAASYQGDFTHRLYPYGASVIVGTALRWARWLGVELRPGESPENDRWLWAVRLRWFSILMSLVAAAAVTAYLVSVYGEVPALFTGLLLVFEPLSAQHAHYGMNDVPLASFLLLAALASTRMVEDSSKAAGAAAITGLLLGAGFGVKYQAVFGGLFPLLAAWSAPRRGARARLTALAIVAAGFAVGALVTCPPLRGHPSRFLTELPYFLEWQTDITGQALPLDQKLVRNLPELGRLLLGHDLWLLLLGAMAGAVLASAGNVPRRRQLAVSSAGFIAAVLATFVSSRDFLRANDLVSVIPFLIVLCGLGLGRIWKEGPRRVAAAGLLLAGIVTASFAVESARDALALRRPDTRERAREWCRANLPRGASVLRDRYALPLKRGDLTERLYRFLSEPRAQEVIEADAYDFVITSSFAYERFFDPRSLYVDEEARTAYERIFSLRKVAEFRDRELSFTHPVVTVWARE